MNLHWRGGLGMHRFDQKALNSRRSPAQARHSVDRDHRNRSDNRRAN
jgi:hypothetical protein